MTHTHSGVDEVSSDACFRCHWQLVLLVLWRRLLWLLVLWLLVL